MAALSCYQPCRPHLAQPARCYDEPQSLDSQSLSLRRRQFIERCQEACARPRVQTHTESRSAHTELGIPDNSGRQSRVELGIPDGSNRQSRAEFGIVDNSCRQSRTELGIPDRRDRDSLSNNGGALQQARRRLNVESGWTKVEEVRRKFEGAAASASYSRSFESPPRRRLADSIFASFKLPRWKESMAGAQQPKRQSAAELLAATKAFYVKSETVRDRKQELPLRVSSGLSQAIAAGGCHVVSSAALPNDLCCNPYATSRIPRRSNVASAGNEGLQNTLRRLLDAHEDEARNRRMRTSNSRSREEGARRDVPPLPLPHIPSPVSSAGSGNAALLGAISPPAQYRHDYVYTRSNSQSAGRGAESGNINSHKSLPDLHAHAADHAVAVPATCETRSPRRRHSSHQRTASSSSRGTRSNHSSMISSSEAFSEHPSPGEENCHYNRNGCGFARDSGGSSGHYTQRTHDRHALNDSEWSAPGPLVSAPAQFQDGAPPPAAAVPPPHTAVSIHFQASAPPPQFQDEPVYDKFEYSRHYRDYNRYHEEVISKQPQYARPRQEDVTDGTYVNTAQLLNSPEEVTSPLGTFKRQRCLRYKQRRPRPILRSKSDISDRYRRTEGRSPASAPCEVEDSLDSVSDESDKLDRFFSRLGLESRQFDAIVGPSRSDSPVFFSSRSSRDSNQLMDYTVQGPPQKQIYRNTEPPSVVERNARIVKWLCQCRKLQQAQH